MAEPIIYHNKTIDRGLASSADFNSLINDIFHDMNNLSSAVNENQNILNETVSMVRHENDALLSRIASLEYALSDASDMFNALKAGLKARTIRSMISEPGNVVSATNFDIQDMYNVGIPAITKTYEKLRVTDKPNPQLYVSVKEVCTSQEYNSGIFVDPTFIYDSTTTPDLLCMFDGSYDLFFARSAKSQDAKPTDSLYCMFDIQIPLNVVNNIKINCIKINPIPKYTLDLMSVEYKDLTTGDWTELPVLSNTISKIPSVLITFPTIETTEIRFVIRQSKHTTTQAYDNSTITEFFYGFQEVSLQLLEPTSDKVSFITKLPLESNGTYFKSVISAELIIDDFEQQDIDCQYTLYKDYDVTEASNAIDFGETIMQNVDVLYLETVLSTKGSVIPVIKGVKALCEIK